MCDILTCENLLDVFHNPLRPQLQVCSDMIQSIDNFLVEILLSNIMNIKPNSNHMKFKLVFFSINIDFSII